ncbi:hypothetical protein ACGF0J_12810 [Nonomuraea sp. NPDC047897]|uniref:hypothetical protein n=1 Tax=Nonomuraea sp. NPDC047897 TaxID=3364346 RepID=UPI00372358A3
MEPGLLTRILQTAAFVVRLALLALLLAGMVIISAGLSPASRTLEQFRGAVLAGEVDRVDYRVDGSGDVVSLAWSQSPLSWYRVLAPIADAAEPYTAARLMADVRRAPVPPSLTSAPSGESDNNGVFPDWPFGVPGGWWIATSWVLVFLAMLSSTPRLANRWAWFWMFTVGQLGVFLYLVLEPRPLWRGPGEGLTRPRRVDGVSGCGYAFLLGFGWMLATFGIGRLVAAALG